MNTREQLEKARALIQAKRYNEARRLLVQIDHPTADKWLTRLDEIAPVTTRSNGNLILMVAGGLVIISLLLLVVFLVSRPGSETAPIIVTATPDPATANQPIPTQEAVIQPTAVVQEIAPSPIPPIMSARGWEFSEQTSIMDDTRTVALIRDADMPVTTWLSTALPSIVLRCRAGRFEIYINANTQFDSDTELDDDVFVRVRWDNEPPETIRMGVSTDGDAAFFSDPKETLRRMARHEKLIFGFVPFNAPEAATSFTMAGLGDVIQPLVDACGLPPFGS